MYLPTSIQPSLSRKIIEKFDAYNILYQYTDEPGLLRINEIPTYEESGAAPPQELGGSIRQPSAASSK